MQTTAVTGARAGYLTVGEVAAYLRIPSETIYKYVRSGRIPGFKVGKHWRFTRDQIDHWVSKRPSEGRLRLRALVVDDEEGIRKLMRRWLHDVGVEVEVAATGDEAIRRVLEQPFHVVFLDLVMPEMTGVETLRALKKISPGSLVVIISAYFDSRLMDEALDLGPLMAMKKPLSMDAVHMLVGSLANCGRGFALGRG